MEPSLGWWDRRNQEWADGQIAATKKVLAGDHPTRSSERLPAWASAEFAVGVLLPLSSRSFDGPVRTWALVSAGVAACVAVVLALLQRIVDRTAERSPPAERQRPRLPRWYAIAPLLLCGTFIMRLAWPPQPKDLILPWAVLGLVGSAALSFAFLHRTSLVELLGRPPTR
jgi:hypothetical protein